MDCKLLDIVHLYERNKCSCHHSSQPRFPINYCKAVVPMCPRVFQSLCKTKYARGICSINDCRDRSSPREEEEEKKKKDDRRRGDSFGSNRERFIQNVCEHHLPTPLQIYDGIINNNKFVANLYRAK